MMKRLVLVFLAACGGGGGGDDDVPGDPDPDFDDSAAMIEVAQRTFEGGGDTGAYARLVTEAPTWPYDVEPVDGACRFSTRVAMTCVDICDGVCVGDVCEPQPLVQSAGDLTLASPSATRTVPFGGAGYSFYEASLVFDAGESLTVSAPGADFEAFELTADVPAPFAITNRDDLMLAIGTPLTIRWEPADPGSRVRLFLGADLGHAQYRSVVVECDAPDEDGAITVPQDMVDRLADPSNWSCGDCFPQSIRRYHRARGTSGTIDVQLWVTASDDLYLVPTP